MMLYKSNITVELLYMYTYVIFRREEVEGLGEG